MAQFYGARTAGKKQFELTQIRLASSDSEAKGIESAVHAPIKEEFFHSGGELTLAAPAKITFRTGKAAIQNLENRILHTKLRTI